MQEVKPVKESCNSGENNRLSESAAGAKRSFTVNGVTFNMIRVEGGTFTMGSTPEQRNPEDDEKPPHRVTLSSYMIGETEVTQGLWKAVTGESIQQIVREHTGWRAHGEGNDYPMYDISWNNCQEFIRILNYLTGLTFRLPTEAEWEFAARGGNKSKSYQYSGSNNIDDVAWYGDKFLSNPVATKAPNELGIYDMSGNVWEWCQDWKGNYSRSAQTNPQGPSSGTTRVIRGGGFSGYAYHCRLAYRADDRDPDISDANLGFRLVLSEECGNTEAFMKDTLNCNMKPVSIDIAESSEARGESPSTNIAEGIKTACDKCSFTVNGVSFNMIRVDGGTFIMGMTYTNVDAAKDKDNNGHRVALSCYMIGETEVTQELWLAVMGTNPSSRKDATCPVENVSWHGCQNFIDKLNSLTGQKFRLPTEAEWEFAARGGNKSNGYFNSGSKTIGDVAWYTDNSYQKTHPVATKAPNELGIYDMSGNVREWCQDVYWRDYYSISFLLNPKGPSSGQNRVHRGGAYCSWSEGCNVYCRDCNDPYYGCSFIGFRLALSDVQGNHEVFTKDSPDCN